MNAHLAYQPTAAERTNTLAKGDFLQLSGDGVFATWQGEGANAGEPVVFLRLQHCNLQCGAGGPNRDEGWTCDTWYTWDRRTLEFWRETSNRDYEGVAAQIFDAWDAMHGDRPERRQVTTGPRPTADRASEPLRKRLVVSGGEPLLQQEKLAKLLPLLPEFDVEIETNGTIVPSPALANCQLNCSPKLGSSGNTLRARYRPEALRAIAQHPNSWFKFVIVNPETDLAEVQQIIVDIGIDPARVMLMSEGSNGDKLRDSDKRLGPIAQALGFTLTSRHHVFWFGNERAT